MRRRPRHRERWMGVEFRHLTALLAIVEHGTISEAAANLGYVQSAVSAQLATLERLAGSPLVDRSYGGRPQQLTEAGEILLAHARDIIRARDAAHVRLSRPGFPVLRIGVTPSVADPLARAAVGAVVGARESLGIASVVTVGEERLPEALAGEEVDVALTALPFSHDAIATAEVTRESLVLAVQGQSPLARQRRGPTLEELANVPLIAWLESQHPSRIELELAGLGVHPNVTARADGSDVVAQLVAAGVGAALVPRSTVVPNSLVSVAEVDLDVSIRITGVAWRAGRADRGIDRFVEHMTAVRLQHGCPG